MMKTEIWITYYISDESNNRLFRNNGGNFSDEVANAGLSQPDTVPYLDQSGYFMSMGWGCGFFDLDNDTDLDLFVASGDVYFHGSARPCLDPNKLFLNDGDGTFTDISVSAGVADTYVSRGFAHCDYDNDGDIDLWVGIVDTVADGRHSFIYQNNLETGNWLKVSLEGVVANRDGFGARIEVMFNGRTLIREVDGGSSFNSHHSSIVHFGLADVNLLDTLRVIWPGGYVDEFYDVSTNQHLTIVEQSGNLVTGVNAFSVAELTFAIYPNPVTGNLVSYSIRTRGNNSYSLKMYDATGRMVSVLFENLKIGPTRRSNFILPEHVSSGIYTLMLTDGMVQKEEKLVLIR